MLLQLLQEVAPIPLNQWLKRLGNGLLGLP